MCSEAERRCIPQSGPERWRALRLQALGDGIMDAVVMVRYEGHMRPKEFASWPEMLSAQRLKVTRSLDALEQEAAGIGGTDVGTIAVACALGYLDLRLEELGWREERPRLAAWYSEFAKRDSMRRTHVEPSVDPLKLSGSGAYAIPQEEEAKDGAPVPPRTNGRTNGTGGGYSAAAPTAKGAGWKGGAPRVLIIGGGNIGSALRAKLEETGADVRMASRSSADVQLDITSDASVRALSAQIGAGSVDHVVVATGTSTYGPLEKFGCAEWRGNLNAKLGAVSSLVVDLCREGTPLRDGGSIIVTSGQAATTANKMWPGLAANNAGLNALVISGGIGLPRGLRLNAVSPCLVTETALKAGLPTSGTVSAAECAEAYVQLITSADTGVVREAGSQVAFKRADNKLANTSDL